MYHTILKYNVSYSSHVQQIVQSEDEGLWIVIETFRIEMETQHCCWCRLGSFRKRKHSYLPCQGQDL